MKKEYTAPEFDNLDLRYSAIMDIVGKAGGGIEWGDDNASAGGDDVELED